MRLAKLSLVEADVEGWPGAIGLLEAVGGGFVELGAAGVDLPDMGGVGRKTGL